MLGLAKAGEFPVCRVLLGDQEHFFYSTEDQAAFLAKLEAERKAASEAQASAAGGETKGEGAPAAEGQPAKAEEVIQEREQVVIQELHEARELKKTVARLGELGFGLAELLPEVDYDANDPRYWLVNEGTRVALAGLLELLPKVREFGREGLDIQRYKGLGEMNPDQLWKTTLDPGSRSMLRVSLGNALEAEEMFSLLMGEEVSSRRRYIENHALEISNLDV